jgi:O-antigen/teichoic acid export membrane protein
MILLNVLIKPLWILGIDRQVQVVVGAEVYGKYFALLSLAFIFNIFLDIGITNYANRNIAANRLLLSSVTANGLAAKLILSVLYTILLFIIAKSSGITDNKLLALLIALQILTSLLLFARGIVSALQLFKTDALLSIIDKALMIIVAGLWLYTPLFGRQLSIYDFTWLQAGTIAITLLISFFVLLKKKVFKGLGLKIAEISKIIIQSFPFALTIFFMGLHNRTDAFLLERMHTNGAYEAGVYAAAYRLLDAANMVGYLFATVLVSYWARHINDTISIKKSLSFSHQLLIPAGILLAVIALFLNQPLYELLYHHQNLYAGKVLQWCLVTIVPCFITHIYGTMLTATGKIKTFMWLVLFSAICNLTLNWMLIPAYGAKACVLAGLISQTMLALLTVIYVKKETVQSVGIALWLKYLLVAVVISATLFFLNKTGLGIWIKLLVTLISWLITMNLLQIFSIKSFLRLINEK